MTQRAVGHIRVDAIVETERPEFPRAELFPDVAPERWHEHEAWLGRSLDPVSGDLVLAIRSYLVRTPRHTMLIDTCVGDRKKRWREVWTDTNSGTLLRGLEEVGVGPKQVDFVISTHLHADHVGWNTRLADGAWVPTFPNARYVVSRSEWAHWQALHAASPRDQITDSVLPIIRSGLAVLVGDDDAVTEDVRLRSSPGHTPHHVCVELASGKSTAIITGDLLHHPVQCAEPEWRMAFDHDADLAIQTRRAFLEHCAETGMLVCASHFPSPPFGHIVRAGRAFRFRSDSP